MIEEELEKEAEDFVMGTKGKDAIQKQIPYFDFAQMMYLAGAEPREKHIAELEETNAVLERRIERAKECMKKLLFIINSEPSNYNCKGLVRDAEDFIYSRTCNIRKSGNHCITEEPCIMCDR